MVSNGGIDFVASGRDKSHQCPEAVALQGNPPGRLGQLDSGADCLRDIARASIAIIRSVKPQTVLPVSFRPYVKINVRLLPPEEVRRDRGVSVSCQLVASRPNVGVNTKQFLQNDH